MTNQNQLNPTKQPRKNAPSYHQRTPKTQKYPKTISVIPLIPAFIHTKNKIPMMRIAVIADDLTGALDTGVQFTQWGYTTQLVDSPEDATAEVIIINTDTRNKSQEEAYKKTYAVAEKLDVDLVYKKTDSTLRGNPGPELQAILDALGEEKAVFTPTYPPTGRRVKNGHLYVNEKPITETEYITEYRNKTSYIPDILETKTPVHVIEYPGDALEAGINIFDSKTEHDLNIVATHQTRVMAGSAGLADALCQRLRAPPPVLSIVGSMRVETRAQITLLRDRLGASLIPLDTIGVLNGSPQEVIQDAEDALSRGRDVVITSSISPDVIEHTWVEARRLNLSANEVEKMITDALAEVTEALLPQSLSGLIITGGATALAVTTRLKIENIMILDEVQPGIPVLRLDNILAITKAGGFGQPDTLIQATKYLKRKHR